MKGFFSSKHQGTQCPSAPLDPTQNTLDTARSRPGARHFLCILLDLLPALASLRTRAAPQMPPAGAQGQTEPGLAVLSWAHWEGTRKETGTGTCTLGSLCRPPMAQATLCPLCQRETRLSPSWCWNSADPMGKTQLSSLRTWPQSPWFLHQHCGPGCSQFTPLCTPNMPYVMAPVFVAPTESALKLGSF